MSKFYVGQTVISKKDNKRCIIEYRYDNDPEEREYRVTFDADKKMKILKEADLEVIRSTYSTAEFRSFSISDLEQGYVRKYKLYYLFHFTHKANLENIIKNGLLPKNQLIGEKKEYRSIADADVQAIRAGVNFYLMGKINKAIHDRVPLYISWRTPTLYRVLHASDIKQSDIVYILVNTYSILRKNYCFTDGNAASICTKQYVLINNLDKLDWDVIKSDAWGGDDDKVRKKNAEFLIYPKVEVRDFYKLVVSDEIAKEEIDDIIKKNKVNLEVQVDQRYYEWPKLFY